MTTVPLKFLAELEAGQSPPSAEVDLLGEGLPFIQGKAEFGTETPRPLFQCHAPPKMARAGDILVSVRAPVGATNLARGVLGIGRGVAAIRPTKIDQRFLWWWLTTQSAPLNAVARGSTFTAVTVQDLGNLQVPLPDSETQRSTADFLDRETAKIDTLIAKQEALVARLREHHQSSVAQAVEAVLDPESGARFKHFVTEMRQGWSPQCESVPADGVTEWGVLKTGCVNGGVFRPQENKLLPADVAPRPETVVRRGEVVISRASTRDLVGSAAVVEGDFPRLMLSDKTYAITVDRRIADAWFVSAFLGTARLRQAIELEATGASHSMQNVSKADLLNLAMPLPPLRSQVEAAQALQVEAPKVDAMVGKAEKLSAMLKERRAALITAAVTGKLDIATYGKAG